MTLSGYFWFIMAYIVVVVFYGLYIAKTQVKTNEEFVTCGRRLPLWIVVGTLIATHFSSRYDAAGCQRLLAECIEIFPSTVLAEDFLAYTVESGVERTS